MTMKKEFIVRDVSGLTKPRNWLPTDIDNRVGQARLVLSILDSGGGWYTVFECQARNKVGVWASRDDRIGIFI